MSWQHELSIDNGSSAAGHRRETASLAGKLFSRWVQTVNADDGTFKNVAYLADLYEKAGFSPGKQVITYCQTGVRGAHTWFVLSQLLGYPNVRNYDGSWAEWGNDPAKPIEQ